MAAFYLLFGVWMVARRRRAMQGDEAVEPR